MKFKILKLSSSFLIISFILFLNFPIINVLAEKKEEKSIQEAQINIEKVELMPNIPMPYEMRNWRQVAIDYDSFLFNFSKSGDYLPLISWDKRWLNFNQDTFYLPSYVGVSTSDEAINGLAAVVGASLVGINKSNQNGHNWVLMCENWYNIDSGQFLYLNNRYAFTGGSFWYELLPSILFYQLANFYPETGQFQVEMHGIADLWYEACKSMGAKLDPWTIPDFYYTAFDFSKMNPIYNGYWREPDAAAAVAWLEYIAYTQWKNSKYLSGTKWCLDYLEEITFNPLYEILLPYGAYIAARANAEQGTTYDVQKIINWCFGPANARYGWGVITETWGDYDCYGLHGSITDGGGYAFTMGTFQNVGGLVPIARYDTRFARAIGKYVLNAANAARLYYGIDLDAQHQDSEDWINNYDYNHCIAYEALRKEWGGIAPLATGDVNRNRYQNQIGPTNLGLYGSSHVGIFGGIISPTNDEKILQLNCLTTDYYHDVAYPTYLYFNPYNVEKSIEIDVGANEKDLYDAISNSFIKTRISGLTSFTIPNNSARVVVEVPSNGIISYEGNKALVNGVIIDYLCDEILNPPASETTVVSTDETTTRSILSTVNRAWIIEQTIHFGIVITVIIAFSGILRYIFKKKFV